MRVLVTGGAGFIGSHLVRACLESGDAVRVLDDLSTGRASNLDAVRGDIEWLEGSVSDPRAAARAVDGCEVVYHEAAISSVQRSIEDPIGTAETNATGTLILLEASRAAGVRRLVYASSASIYGNEPGLPKVETMTPRPLSPYALHKWTGERYCALWSQLFALDTVSLRYFNVFGPRQDPDSPYGAAIPKFSAALAKGERPRVYGDGEQSRDFVFVSDVVRANRLAASAPAEMAGAVVNVSRGRRVTILETLRGIAEALGREDLEPRFEPARTGEVRHSEGDPGEAARLLGWTAETALREGLRQTALWFAGSEPAA